MSHYGPELYTVHVARGGVEYDDNAPATVLDAWLKQLAENKRASEKMLPGNFYQGCVFAWNAYRDGKSLSNIKYDSKKGLHRASE
jgi:hypothetical protein